MAKTIKTPLAALGAAFLATSVAPLASADVNPFTATQLNGGYDLANYSDHEGKCGGKKVEEEGKCGGSKVQKEGKCGDKTESEGKCGGEKAKPEGKCGEGKCGNR